MTGKMTVLSASSLQNLTDKQASVNFKFAGLN